jgi:phosphohistidine phosphatase SixA
MRQIITIAFLMLCPGPAFSQPDLPDLIRDLKAGGHTIVFRHGATDESQKDAYPFKFDDMSAQRQLSDKGRDTGRQIGEALSVLRIPVGLVYTSRLNRAVETAKLIGKKDVVPSDALTDSGAGNPSSMANPTGTNSKAGKALREIANAQPPAGTNNLLITHKTNIADAFGKEYSDIGEGWAIVVQGRDGSTFVVRRVSPQEWTASQ